MENEFSRAAEDYRLDAVAQIEGVERGTVADVNEAIHRAVNAIAFIKLTKQLQEIIGIAEGRRSAEKWLCNAVRKNVAPRHGQD
jgi:hypothetical protein